MYKTYWFFTKLIFDIAYERESFVIHMPVNANLMDLPVDGVS